MDLQNEKRKSCILFKSIVDAAEELDKDQALELLLTYAHYGLGETIDLNNCSKIVKLILMQNIEALDAADRRYQAAVENGKKGKDFGKLGGRPRKGETKEQANERRRKEEETGVKDEYEPPKDEKREKAKNLAKNYKRSDEKYGRGETTITPTWIKDNILSGQKCVYCGESDWHLLGCDRIDNTKPHTPDNVVCSCSKCNIERGQMSYKDFITKKTETNSPVKPQNDVPQVTPVKPLNVDVDAEVDAYAEVDVAEDAEAYMRSFLGNPTKDYRCLLDNVPYFINRNNSDLLDLQESLKKKCNCDYTLDDIISSLQFLYKEKINYKSKS